MAVALAGSTATLISDSVLVATDAFGTGLVLLGPSALYASGGNQGVSVASTTLLAGMGGTGALLDADNQGTLSLASVTVRGARFGVRIATPGAGASLSIASMTFESLQAGATAIRFLGGVFISSFTDLTFADPGLGVNIDAAALSPGSRITVRVDTGAHTGPHFENDPGGYVEWADFQRPGVPGALVGATLGVSSLSWTWSATSGTEFYRLFQASSPATLIATSSSPAAVMTGLSTNTAYGVILKAGNIQDEGGFSASATAYTFAAEPTAPAFDAVWTTSMTISWSANGNPSGTNFSAQLSGAADFSSLAGSSQTPVASASFSGLSPKTTYYLRVRAINGGAVFTDFSAAASTRTKPSLPSAPGTPSGISPGPSSIAWTWPAAADAELYKVYQASSPATLVAASTAPAVVLTALSTNTAYGIVVRAGNIVGEGPVSASATAYTLAAPPAAAAFGPVSMTSMTAVWSANGNPSGTNFLAQLSAAADFSALAGSSQTLNASAAFSGLSSKTTYHLRVLAMNGDSILTAFSASASTVTKPPLPSAPGTPAASALGTSSISWTWSAAVDAESYLLFDSTQAATLLGSATSLSLVASGFTANSSHSAAAFGANASGTGPPSAPAASFYTYSNP
ncbi:MAG: fibronectin type III domain-containing protein, partial [Elusimicrobiota bacterium]